MRKHTQAPFTISPEEIKERLRLPEKEQRTVDDLYGLSHGLLMEEDRRAIALDSKAHNLAAVAGVCLTLMLSGGALVLQDLRDIVDLPWLRILGVFYIVASICSLSALGLALFAARPRSGYKTLRQEDLFKKCELTCEKNRYRRYLITHLWKIYQNNFCVNQNKGSLLRIAYMLFFGSLVLLLSMGVIASVRYMR